MSGRVRITDPISELTSLIEAKNHLRVSINTDDTLISDLIVVARERAEDFTRRALITQEWEYWLDDWPSNGIIELPYPPLQSVTDIKYYDTTGTEYTLAATEYIVDETALPGRVMLGYQKVWPTTILRPTKSIKITFWAGYLPATAPRAIVQAVLQMIGHFYENRESVVVGNWVAIEIPVTAERLLWPYRAFWHEEF